MERASLFDGITEFPRGDSVFYYLGCWSCSVSVWKRANALNLSGKLEVSKLFLAPCP